MDMRDLQSFFDPPRWSTDRRTLRLSWGGALDQTLAPVLLAQRALLTEGLCEPTEARITCLSLQPRLPLRDLLGAPFALQLSVPGQGAPWRSFPLVVTEASLGRSDGGFTAVHLVGRDAMSLMAQRRRLRTFRRKGVLDVAQAVFGDWQDAGLRPCFTFREWGVQQQDHPVRAGFIQHPDESDASFIQRLLRGAGIAWCWRPEAGHGDDGRSLPRQELLLLDDGRQLPAHAGGPVRYHRRDHPQHDGCIDLLAPLWRLVPDGVALRSWDHELARVDAEERCTGPQEVAAGYGLAAALREARVCVPHLGNDGDDLERLARVRLDHQRFRAYALHGRGGVRTLAPGTHQVIEDYPGFDGAGEAARDHVTVRVEHLMHGSLPGDLHAAAQALLGDEGLPAWARGDDSTGGPGAAAAGPRYVNRFLMVPRGTPIVPADDPVPQRLRPLTGIVVAAGPVSVDCDELDRVRVQLVGGEPGTDTTAWVRHQTPWAGTGVGFSARLRPGTEVDVDWLGPDRPVITGCHYNGGTPPPRVAHRGSLPANFSQTALVGRELRGTRQQHLLLDDMPGQLLAQLASEAGHSALSLGELTTPRREGQAEPRGNGFELRSDDSGALRTAKALLISAWGRLQACGGQLSAEEHVALMQEALELFKALGQYAAQHHGLAADAAGQEALHADVKAATGGSNVDPKREGGAPTLSLTAPAGIAATTPKTIVQVAGVNIDSVAQQHLQWTAGQRLVANAGQGVGLFAHHGGIQAIAHHGNWLLQSQHGDTQIDSGQDLKLGAQRRIVGLGQDEVTFMTAGGAFLKLCGPDVEIGGPGVLRMKGASHQWEGPARMDGELPTFNEGDLGRVPRLLNPTSGEPVPGMRVRVEHEGGVLDGRTDAQGLGTKVVSNTLRRLKAFFFDQRS